MGNMMRIGRTAAVAALLLAALTRPALAEEPWQASFERTCSKSSEAMSLSVEELRALLDECAALETVIGKQEASLRKVYTKRLQLCRNLFAYMLEYKTAQAPK